jgi:hypothetical protein
MDAEGIPTVTVRLWQADAVVLYDWLTTTDLKRDEPFQLTDARAAVRRRAR